MLSPQPNHLAGVESILDQIMTTTDTLPNSSTDEHKGLEWSNGFKVGDPWCGHFFHSQNPEVLLVLFELCNFKGPELPRVFRPKCIGSDLARNQRYQEEGLYFFLLL